MLFYFYIVIYLLFKYNFNYYLLKFLIAIFPFVIFHEILEYISQILNIIFNINSDNEFIIKKIIIILQEK